MPDGESVLSFRFLLNIMKLFNKFANVLFLAIYYLFIVIACSYGIYLISQWGKTSLS